MFNFLLPKQFFISEKKIHKNLYEYGIICDCKRFDNGNIILSYYHDITAILDKNYEVLYKENLGEIHHITIINNEQFIGIKDDGMFLFSFIFSNDINSDNPSEPLNQKKLLKLFLNIFLNLTQIILQIFSMTKKLVKYFCLSVKISI